MMLTKTITNQQLMTMVRSTGWSGPGHTLSVHRLSVAYSEILVARCKGMTGDDAAYLDSDEWYDRCDDMRRAVA